MMMKVEFDMWIVLYKRTLFVSNKKYKNCAMVNNKDNCPKKQSN